MKTATKTSIHLYAGLREDYMIPAIGDIFNAMFKKKSIDTIAIPADIKRDELALWEFGGATKHGFGTTMIVGTPEGKIIDRPLLFQRNSKPNGRHAQCKVWPGCLVGMGKLYHSKVNVIVFRIKDLTTVDSFGYDTDTFKKNGGCIMKKVATCTKTFQGPDIDIAADEPNKDGIIDMISATIDKVQTVDCVKSVYMNPWGSCNKTDKYRIMFETVNPDIPLEELNPIDSRNIANMISLVGDFCGLYIQDTFVPVRQLIRKSATVEDGYDVIMCVISPPKKTDSELDGSEVQPMKNYIGTITEDSKLPANRFPLLGAKDWPDFVQKVADGRTDNWLLYRGA